MMSHICYLMSSLLLAQNVPLSLAAVEADRSMTIAVVDFTNTGGDSSFDYLSKTIPENLITSLAEQGDLKIVERGRLQEALKEMKLQLTDIVDEASAVRLGKAVGASAIIVGSFVNIGEKIRISSRLIDVQTATVITGRSATGRVGEDIFRVMDEMAASMKQDLLQRSGSGASLEVQRVPVSPPQSAKRGGNKTLLYVLGGAAIVGAGVAVALAAGGGDDTGSQPATVTISVSW